VKIDLEDADDGSFNLVFDFLEWNVAATTIVGKPAFADAAFEFPDDETLASAYADESPLVVDFESFSYEFAAMDETTASVGLAPVPWADFHIPEADHPQKIVVDAEGRIFGHLARWDVPHDGFPDRLVRVPRPRDGYASFNQAGPLTELGQVETGPIFFAGGHPKKPLGNRDPFEAYGDVTNCWGDVRCSAGKFGPWISGRVRPGVDDATIYAARASRISGHWVGDRLRAIVSCNVEGFPVGGSGMSVASYSEDGELLEMVASFVALPGEETAEVDEVEEVAEITEEPAAEPDPEPVAPDLAREAELESLMYDFLDE
jgi:hypothetical protein